MRRVSKAAILEENRGFIFVRRRGLEPPRIAPLVPKTSAYTNFATCAYLIVTVSIAGTITQG